jgi:aspartyl-tRNA(Asn)/glutamyl-tRNA(Gln) amidotransferase subunit B
VERALAAAAAWQRERLEQGEEIRLATFGWDEGRERLLLQRAKEEAHDYRYFPEPDLVPLEVSEELLEKVRAGLPELPWARRERFVREYRLSPREVEVLLGEPELADYFERVATAVGDGREAANWILTEVLRFWQGSPPLPAEELALLIQKVRKKEISRTTAKELLEEAIGGKESLERLLAGRAVRQLTDEAELEKLAREAMSQHPQAVADFQAGKTQALGFLVGQVMRKTKGRADASKLAQIFQRLLAS